MKKGGEELPELEGGKKGQMKKGGEELPELEGGKKGQMKKGGFEPSSEPIYGLSPANVEMDSTPKTTGGKKGQMKRAERHAKLVNLTNHKRDPKRNQRLKRNKQHSTTSKYNN